MSLDLALLIVRVVVGLLFVGHGAQKLFGWFGGYGLNGTAGFMGSLGLRPAKFWTLLAGLSELGGGALLALGLLNPLGPVAIIAAMLVATAKVHGGKGLWVTEGGMEYNLVLIAASLAVGLAGAGSFSMDAVLGIALPAPISLIVGLVASVLGTGIALLSAPRSVASAQGQELSQTA
ncbi:MAG: DoxX family protein [Chloroflexota bacterium]|nr:MAG: DoxX family protein [Chloroflexota bacterium]